MEALGSSGLARRAGPPVGVEDRRSIVGADPLAMPFAGKYDDTFFIAMIEAAKSNDVSCIRVDHTEYSGDVVKEIKRRISRSVAVIADISEARPNVLFEAGYAEARSKPVIYICSTPMIDVPFDVRNEPIIQYAIGQSKKLLPKLTERLRAILE